MTKNEFLQELERRLGSLMPRDRELALKKWAGRISARFGDGEELRDFPDPAEAASLSIEDTPVLRLFDARIASLGGDNKTLEKVISAAKWPVWWIAMTIGCFFYGAVIMLIFGFDILLKLFKTLLPVMAVLVIFGAAAVWFMLNKALAIMAVGTGLCLFGAGIALRALSPWFSRRAEKWIDTITVKVLSLYRREENND